MKYLWVFYFTTDEQTVNNILHDFFANRRLTKYGLFRLLNIYLRFFRFFCRLHTMLFMESHATYYTI